MFPSLNDFVFSEVSGDLTKYPPEYQPTQYYKLILIEMLILYFITFEQ